MLKKLAHWLAMLAIVSIIFVGCSKPPPPPPVSVSQVDKACEEATAAKTRYESFEKERDMLQSKLKERQAKLEAAKKCAEGK